MSTDATHTDIRKTVSSVLGIENSAAWDIVSFDPEHNLYMVHHKAEADLIEYGQIRGIVIDSEAKAIVCQSYGYSPTVVTNHMVIDSDTNMVKLTDNNGENHVFDPTMTTIKAGFEGTLITVFKHGGKVYRTTRKRLDASRSRWGDSETFLNMYWSLGGPADEVLFTPKSDYSPYCHSFIAVHPDVLVVSKDNIGTGYLVYLGPKPMWSVSYDECPYKQTQEDGSLFEGVTQEQFDKDERPNAGWIDDTLMTPATISDADESDICDSAYPIFLPPDLSIDEANKHLKFGFYNKFEGWDSLDKRLLPGEFLVLTTDEGKMLRVESEAYSWRSAMRDNDPNLFHRFFQLVNGSYLKHDTDESKAHYDKLYPTFSAYDTLSIQTHLVNSGFYVVWPQSELLGHELKTKDSRLYNIWLGYLNSVPLHRQIEVAGYLEEFYMRRKEVINWLKGLSARGKLDKSEFSHRVMDLIETSQKFARRAVEQGKNFDRRRGRKKSLAEMTKDNIRNFIMKEEGGSLYRLMREMMKWKREQNPQ